MKKYLIQNKITRCKSDRCWNNKTSHAQAAVQSAEAAIIVVNEDNRRQAMEDSYQKKQQK